MRRVTGARNHGLLLFFVGLVGSLVICCLAVSWVLGFMEMPFWNARASDALFDARLRADVSLALEAARLRRPFYLSGRSFTTHQCAEWTILTAPHGDHSLHVSEDGMILFYGDTLAQLQLLAELVAECKKHYTLPAAQRPRAECGTMPGPYGPVPVCSFEMQLP